MCPRALCAYTRARNEFDILWNFSITISNDNTTHILHDIYRSRFQRTFTSARIQNPTRFYFYSIYFLSQSAPAN